MSESRSEALRAEAKELERQANAKYEEARVEFLREQRARPLLDRMEFASTARCPCGAGLAYDPVGASGGYPEDGGVSAGYWDCSAILLGTATPGTSEHTDRLPFAFYSIKAESQPSARGVTTRPAR